MTEKVAVSKASIYFLSVTALFIALTYVFTAFVNIRLPIAANGGLIHLGNVPLFIAAILFGRKVGAIAGGVGMALFDLGNALYSKAIANDDTDYESHKEKNGSGQRFI